MADPDSSRFVVRRFVGPVPVFKSMDVGQILRPTGRPLVPEQFGSAEEGYREVSRFVCHPAGPCFPEDEPRRTGHDVDTARWQADLDDRSRGREIPNGDPKDFHRHAEADERGPHAGSVFLVGVEPQAEVAGRPGDSVHGHRVRSDREETGSRRQEFSENIPEVLGQRLVPCDGDSTLTGASSRRYSGIRRPVRDHASTASGHIMASRSSAVVVALKSSPGSSPSRSLRTGQLRRASALARLPTSFDSSFI